MKDSYVARLLDAMPDRLAMPTIGGPGQHRLAVALCSASRAASTAGDILASHVDPVKGSRTVEGAAIRCGAGRPAAVGDLADLAVKVSGVDEELLAWVRQAGSAQGR